MVVGWSGLRAVLDPSRKSATRSNRVLHLFAGRRLSTPRYGLRDSTPWYLDQEISPIAVLRFHRLPPCSALSGLPKQIAATTSRHMAAPG
jgi:hypothetical protein